MDLACPVLNALLAPNMQTARARGRVSGEKAGYRASHLYRAVWASGAAALGCNALFVVVARHTLAPSLAPVAFGMGRCSWLLVHCEGGDSPFTLIARDLLLLLAAMVGAAACIIGLR